MAIRDKEFLLNMYKNVFISRVSEHRILELYKQGLVKGTVTLGEGNEGAIAGLMTALNPDTDICNLMQRDFGGYLVWGASVYHMFCHYLANAESPTGGKDGNVHHGIVEKGLLPMISHLGAMLPNVVGAVYGRRQRKIPSVGAAIIGDGGTSTGDFHEALNIASVLKVPVLFFIENNRWAYSTPNSLQFNCKRLSDRAVGYGIRGKTILASNTVEVYETVKSIVDEIREKPEPYLLEAITYRLGGHAAYDTADYVPEEEVMNNLKEEPVQKLRSFLIDEEVATSEELDELEKTWENHVTEEANRALQAGKIDSKKTNWNVYISPNSKSTHTLPPVAFKELTAVQAINAALDHAMKNDETVLIIGEDIGEYGGPFKSTKDLFPRYGRARVIDMPLSESGFTGFGIGCAEVGLRPVVEMQFADFSTDAITQIGINAGTFYFRTSHPLPLTIRMPGGGGLSFGPCHSEDLEGLFLTFPGLKLVYPSRVSDFFELLLASIYDENPVLFFENKYLYRRIKGDVNFNGTIRSLERAAVFKEGEDLTVIAYGAMFHESVKAVKEIEEEQGVSVEIIDPLILKPLDWETISKSVKKTHRLLVVHESWRTGSVGENIVSGVVERNFLDLDAPPLICGAPDTPVPFAPELEKVYRPESLKIKSEIEKLLDY